MARWSPQTATITITGTNDAPTVGVGAVADGGGGFRGFTVNLLTGAGDVDEWRRAACGERDRAVGGRDAGR